MSEENVALRGSKRKMPTGATSPDLGAKSNKLSPSQLVSSGDDGAAAASATVSFVIPLPPLPPPDSLCSEVATDDPFAALDPLIIVKHILPHLEQTDRVSLSRVNRRFRELCLDKSLWTKLELKMDGIKVGKEEVKTLLDRWPKLTKFKLADDRNVGEEDRSMVANYALKHCPLLEHLEVEKLSLARILPLIGGASSLRKLFLRDSWALGLAVCTWFSLSPPHRAKYLKNLTHLALALRDGETKHLVAIADHCNQLEYFDVVIDDSKYDDTPIIYFLNKVKGTLKHLLLDEAEDLVNDVGTFLSSRLETLSLSHASELDAYGVNVISSLSHLQFLKLEGTHLDRRDFIRMFKGRKLEKLTHLNLDNGFELTDKGLSVIANNCPRLTHLSLVYEEECDEFFDDDSSVWSDSPSSYFSDSPQPYITDAGLNYLLSKSERLQQLDLGGIDKLSAAAFLKVKAPLRKLFLDEICVESIVGTNFAMLIPMAPLFDPMLQQQTEEEQLLP